MRKPARIVNILLIVGVTLSCTSLPSLAAAGLGSGAQRQDPYEVAVFEHQRFGGRGENWTLEEGMRLRLVDFVGWGLNDRISSIRLGYRVGVTLFADRNFTGKARTYYNSVDLVERDVNDEFSSLIIFPRELDGPPGALLGSGSVSAADLRAGGFPQQSWFFPLEESLEQTEKLYKNLFDKNANDKAEWVFLCGAPHDSRGGRAVIEAVLYEHDKWRGRSAAFPDYRNRGAGGLFYLENYGLRNAVSSLELRDTFSGSRPTDRRDQQDWRGRARWWR